MSKSKISLFAQVLSLIDRNKFSKIVEQYDGDKHSKGLTSWTHLRVLSVSNAQVRFRYRDYRTDQTREMALTPYEFCRRFLQHVLPIGLAKIRHYGLLSNRCRNQVLPEILFYFERRRKDPKVFRVKDHLQKTLDWIQPYVPGVRRDSYILKAVYTGFLSGVIRMESTAPPVSFLTTQYLVPHDPRDLLKRYFLSGEKPISIRINHPKRTPYPPISTRKPTPLRSETGANTELTYTSNNTNPILTINFSTG